MSRNGEGRMDILTVRKYRKHDGSEGTSWTKIGTAFPTRNGFTLKFECLPVATYGRSNEIETIAIMMPPKPRDGGSRKKDDFDPKPQDGDYEPNENGSGEMPF